MGETDQVELVFARCGVWVQTVAEIWLVLRLTGSGVSLGLTTALQFAPMLLLGACYQYGSIWHLIDPEELPLHGRDPAAAVVAALQAGLSPREQPSDRPTTERPA